MAISKRTYTLLNRITTTFLLFGGFLLVFFTTSKMRSPAVSDLPKGKNVVHADAPGYGQGAYYSQGPYDGK